MYIKNIFTYVLINNKKYNENFSYLPHELVDYIWNENINNIQMKKNSSQTLKFNHPLLELCWAIENLY